MFHLIEVWEHHLGKWDLVWEYSSVRYAVADCREVGKGAWAVVGFRPSDDDATRIYFSPVLLANSAYAPAGELMALLRGERQEAA